MGTNESPRNRGVNRAVHFDLAAFTERFFAVLGTDAAFTGPGPVSTTRMDYRPASERFAITYLGEEMFSKYDDGVKSPEKKQAAIRKFEEGEVLCALTNCKFQHTPVGQPPAWLDPNLTWLDEDVMVDRAVFERARAIIGKILGAFPGWDEVLKHADFGPGATTRLGRALSHRSNKWGGQPHVGQSASSVLHGFYEALPLLKQARFRQQDLPFKCVEGNKLDWVPKNYKTDRTIAIEPDMSMFFQKGVGGLLRKRLKRVKQDLSTQDTNRFLAALSSIDGSLATLDLSMASDTVAYYLAKYLIRPDWFEAADCLRSQVGFYSDDGKDVAVVYEKLSSMGNGSTFEWETLIFYGILRAVSELSEQQDHRLYVYGDDIVVPSGMASLAMSYLRKAGFVVNQSKSFWDGPFRESCGGHYFSGTDVTPFYVREAVDNLDRLFLLHNNVYRWFNRHPYICDPNKVTDLLGWIRGHAPTEWQRPRLMTEDVGDGAFIGPFDAVCPEAVGKYKQRLGWEGWRVETLQYRHKRDKARKKEKVRHEWGSFKPPRVYPPGHEDVPEYSDVQDAIAMSLWSLEDQEDRHRKMFQPARDGISLWAKSRDFADWLYPATSGGGDIPLAERWWYVAVQVLPYSTGSSWW